jgi:hypothetical protein
LVSNTYCGVVFLCSSFSSCVLYTLGIQHIVWCSFPLFCLSPVSCIPYVASFSGLSNFDCPFDIT